MRKAFTYLLCALLASIFLYLCYFVTKTIFGIDLAGLHNLGHLQFLSYVGTFLFTGLPLLLRYYWLLSGWKSLLLICVWSVLLHALILPALLNSPFMKIPAIAQLDPQLIGIAFPFSYELGLSLSQHATFAALLGILFGVLWVFSYRNN
ncbi:MAG: hypothetical protein AB8B94_01855 [Hyphomicrobiales bacterium]